MVANTFASLKSKRDILFNNVSILIVEDSITQREELRYILEDNHFTVYSANDGKEAYEKLFDCIPTMVISDINMPNMNGYELCKAIKSNDIFHNIPVILLTSMSDIVDVMNGLESGADNFIVKPYQEEYLLSRISNVLLNIHLKGSSTPQMNLEIYFAEKKYNITSDRLQILNLLLSTYESAVQKNQELIQTKDKLQKLNDELEERILERTRKLRESEQRLNLTLKAAKIGTWDWDFHTGKISWDDYNHSVFDMKPGDFGGTIEDFTKLIHPDDRHHVKVILDGSIKNHSEFQAEFRIVSKDNAIHWIEGKGNVYTDDKGNPVRMLGVNLDITERKELDEANNVLVNQSIQGLFIIQDNRIVFSNPAFCKMSGYTEEELYSFNYEELKNIVHPDDQKYFWERYERRLQGEDIQPLYEFKGLKKNNEMYWMQIYSSRIMFRSKPAIQVAIIDITEKKNTEEQLTQVQKMESVGQLAGGVAHDFNNILMAIKMNTEFALSETDETQPIYEDLNEILVSANRASSLTRQLLAFSRKQVLEPKILNLNQVCENLDKMLKRLIGEHIDFITHLSPDLWSVKADEGQIEQIILNLIVNARDAMPNGGKITLETKNMTLDKEYTDEYLDVHAGKYVMITVSDNGSGIPIDIIKKIFDPFFTTKEKGKGTGLGLSTVYGIVKQSGGSIHVYSEPDEGSVFRIYLPSIDVSTVETAESDSSVKDVNGTEAILVVEDDMSVRRVITRILTNHGYTVLEAHNGISALTVFQEQMSAICLVLTDVIMPEMNGKELSERLYEMKPDTKVIFLSGYTEDAIIHHGVLNEGITLVQKPVSTNDLLQKIRLILDT